MRPVLIFISMLFLLSCNTRKEISIIKKSSVFANSNELGKDKASFISRYGNPINKDLVEDGADLIENLYYVEIIDAIIVTTKIKFVNDRVVEQTNYKMEYSSDKRLKALEDEVESNDLQIFMNQVKSSN